MSTAPSPHDRYRDRLALLADPAAAAEVLGTGKRHYGRFHPGDPVWAVVVTELDDGGLRTVELSDDRLDGSALHPLLGPFRVSGPGDDRALPGLRPVLDLGDGGRIVRYRPGARCTLRTTRDGAPWIVKVLASGPDSADTVARLDRQQRGLARAAETGALSFRIAGPGPSDPALGALWQAVVPGRPIEAELLGPGGADMAHRIGRALAELAAAPLDDVAGPAIDEAGQQLARTGRAVAQLVARVPALAGPAHEIGDALAAAHRRLRPRPTVPVHGAPHMHQWLVDGDLLALIDFDRLHRGDPELDIATLVAELETERRMATPVDGIEEAAVAGYESAGGPLDPERLRLYRLHKRLAKATRTAWALRPDGDRRAAQHLARVAGSLG